MVEWKHYALIDPRIEDEIMRVRYVGRTVQSLEARYSEHVGRARRGCPVHRSNWIRQVIRDGYQPRMISLGVGGEHEESEWIALYRLCGANLTNCTDGGEGGLNPTEAVRAKIAAASRVAHSDPDIKQKRSEAIKASWADEASRARRMEAMAAVCSTEAYKEKIARASREAWAREDYRANVVAALGSPEVRRRMREAALAHRNSAEVRTGIAERARAAWARPEAKARLLAAMGRPEVRQRMSQAATAREKARREARVNKGQESLALCLAAGGGAS